MHPYYYQFYCMHQKSRIDMRLRFIPNIYLLIAISNSFLYRLQLAKTTTIIAFPVNIFIGCYANKFTTRCCCIHL
jgi:hypothetical protein